MTQASTYYRQRELREEVTLDLRDYSTVKTHRSLDEIAEFYARARGMENATERTANVSIVGQHLIARVYL